MNARQLIDEGMDDAEDGGEHLVVSGPKQQFNPLSEIADEVAEAAQYVSGLVDRRSNLDLSSPEARDMMLQLKTCRSVLSDIAEILDTPIK